MAIPSGVILIHVGTHASIPTGWSRETTLDDKYPKSLTSADAGVTGGSNTHTHTSSHSHTMSSHVHSISTNNVAGTATADEGGSAKRPSGSHSHSGADSSSHTGGGLNTLSVTWASVNQEPPYHTVIFIKPSSTVGVITTGICSHYYGASVPIGWNYCNGANSTPDLRNKYLKGAGTGANAGTTGGATSHGHTITHTHTEATHTHTGTTSQSTSGFNGGGDSDKAQYLHQHTYSLDANTGGAGAYTSTTGGSGDTVEIAYKKLGMLQNAGGSLKVGLVAMWLGLTSAIPKNWDLCNGSNGTLDLRDKFVKIGASLANNNETGGANTHTHTAISHTHTASGAHGHTSGNTSASNLAGVNTTGSAANQIVLASHTHTLTVNTATATWANSNISGDSSDHQPAYTTVAYIQLNKISGGGAMLMSRLM